MGNWNNFEDSCFEYLSYSYPNAEFEQMGGADSTIADIFVSTKYGSSFYIETKMENAQCGQFVLLPNEISRSFEYSPKNKYELNKFSEKIIQYMNDNFDKYINSGATGKIINMNPEIFIGWIKAYYASKGVKYFITGNQDFVIVPINKFSNYFSVSAKYRMKKSGSTDPSVENRKEISNILKANSIRFQIQFDGKATFIETTIDLANKQISGRKYNYLFRADGKNRFKVRQLSNTNNSNVIFSICLKSDQITEDLVQFENEL